MGALSAIGSWPPARCAAGVSSARGALDGEGRTDWRFPIASVTKVLTAMAVLVAVEERTVDLDEPAGPPGATLRHLLAHAGGYALTGSHAIAPPGRRRIYSNTGIEVAAALVESRSGIPFADYLTEAVVEPLGMAGTHLYASPAWGARSCVDDLLALGREVLAPRLVAPSTMAEAMSVQFPGLRGVVPGYGRQDPNDWGLGLEVRGRKQPHWTGSRNSPRTVGHFGRSGSFLWVDPDAGLVCAFLGDLDFGEWAHERWPALSDAVLDEHARRPAPGQ
jgi:CubicO group peptidase (beta-lactamase class C family)